MKMTTETKVSEKLLSDDIIMRDILKELRYSALAFSKKLEYSSASTIHHILFGRNKISNDLADKIIKIFPEVNYWFIKKGQLPIILEDKLAKNQFNTVVGRYSDKIMPDYSAETFNTLKNIEVMMARMLEIAESKK
jgi:hypothetical protein